MKPVLLITATAIWFLVADVAGSEQKQLCQLEPNGTDWHYRTRVDGRPEKCWYDGERMKPRSELYWAETPARAPEIIPLMEPMRPPWERWESERWRGAPPGWDHKE